MTGTATAKICAERDPWQAAALHGGVRGLLLAIGCCLALTNTSQVRAEDAGATKLEAEYQQLISDALTEYERGGWEEAAALFQRAHELRPSARTLRGLGLAVYEARRYPDSIRYLKQSLTDTRSPLTPKQREEVEATLQRARLFVGYLHLTLEPANASVALNGQIVQPDTDGNLITDIGTLELEVKADGYEHASRQVQMHAGDQRSLRLRLEPRGSHSATPPLHAAQLPAATTAATQPNDSRYGTWKWVSSGAALAALAAGGTMLIVQKSKADAYTKDCVDNILPSSNCDQRHALLGSTLWTGSIVGLSLGAGLTALSVVLFALDAEPEPSEHATGLRCGAAGTGAACQWRF